MVQILGPDGQPVPPARRSGLPGNRPRALHGRGNAPYDAADLYSPQMAAWTPYLWSPDGETSQFFRDRMVSRSRDIERNDGWARGGITKILDNVIGAQFRPISKPDYRSLAYYTGNSAFDAKWADEFGHAIDACWRTWADDIGHYCDAMQKLTMAQMFWVAMRHKLLDGDALAVMLWRDDLIGPGRARYATSVQLIDPDRLSNPQLRFDQNAMRGGVEVDDYGAPMGYWIRRAHQGDWFSAAKSVQWDFLPRYTDWGRPIVVHDYDHDRASQHHGAVGVLTPVLQRLRMLTRYDSVELEAAIINAIFAAYVKSPFDQEMVQEALDAGDRDEAPLGQYQDMRREFWEGRRSLVGGAQMTHLFPGEEIGTINAARPNSNFEPFEVAILRHVASGIGITYEQLTADFSRTNYSSFRGATNEVLKTFNRRAKNFDSGFAMPIRAAAIEEFMSVEDIPLPAGAPPFEEFRAAYSKCHWLRPGRGWVDPVAEKQGAIIGMEAGLSTLEMEVAENAGLDWEEVVDQRAIELARFKERGLTPPSWADVKDAKPGIDPGDKPTAPGARR
ncbi:MAG TPA: phage portal protein [Rhodopila sp.]|jgi:lambda family phage portal protein|nr:phage portal protein [Rhodopila sp.]